MLFILKKIYNKCKENVLNDVFLYDNVKLMSIIFYNNFFEGIERFYLI